MDEKRLLKNLINTTIMEEAFSESFPIWVPSGVFSLNFCLHGFLHPNMNTLNWLGSTWCTQTLEVYLMYCLQLCLSCYETTDSSVYKYTWKALNYFNFPFISLYNKETFPILSWDMLRLSAPWNIYFFMSLKILN